MSTSTALFNAQLIVTNGTSPAWLETCAAERIALAQWLEQPLAQRWDTVLLLPGNTEQWEHAIARARDLSARAFWVAICDHSYWSAQRLMALGMQRCAPPSGSPDIGLYRGGLHDYKRTPNWLSSQYWANPERWNRQRW